MCAEATTLPPKWVQSTDLLGKDNLGKDFIISYWSDLENTNLDFLLLVMVF